MSREAVAIPALGIVDDDHDRRQALGDPARGGTAATRGLHQLGLQSAVQSLAKARRDVAPLARCEAEPRVVAADRDVYPPADEASVAVGASQWVAVLDHTP